MYKIAQASIYSFAWKEQRQTPLDYIFDKFQGFSSLHLKEISIRGDIIIQNIILANNSS